MSWINYNDINKATETINELLNQYGEAPVSEELVESLSEAQRYKVARCLETEDLETAQDILDILI